MMTKAYLAGFIAGTQGNNRYHCPYWEEGSQCEIEWLRGLVDGEGILQGCKHTGKEIVE